MTSLGVTPSAAHGNGPKESKKSQFAALLLPPVSFCLNFVLVRAGKKTHLCSTRLSIPPLVNDKPLGWEDSLLVMQVSFGSCEEQGAALRVPLGPFSLEGHCGQGTAASKGLPLPTRAPAGLTHLG